MKNIIKATTITALGLGILITDVGATSLPGCDSSDNTPKKCQGEQGIQGIQGIQGKPGAKGEQGIQGEAGTNGTNGTNGKDGNIYDFPVLDMSSINSGIAESIAIGALTTPSGNGTFISLSQSYYKDSTSKALGLTFRDSDKAFNFSITDSDTSSVSISFKL